MEEEVYIEVCETLGLRPYQDAEHEINTWRLYGDSELFLIMAQRVRSLEDKE